jgi:GT2 family glycosyltransferase
VLYGDCDVIDDRGGVLWRERPGRYEFSKLLRRGNYLAQPAVFLRRRVFDSIGYLDESLDYAMDYELWLRLRGLHIVDVPRVLARFRWHASSKTATGNLAHWRERLVILRRYGSGWTPRLAWSYTRARFTTARQGALRALQARW